MADETSEVISGNEGTEANGPEMDEAAKEATRSLAFKPFYELTISVPTYCEKCGKKGLSSCSVCHVACYCSVDCQRKLWKSHKLVCCLLERRIDDLNAVENSLRNSLGPDWLEDKRFRGQFMEHEGTKAWLFEVQKLALEYEGYNKSLSLKLAIHLLMKVIYHDPSDYYGMRYRVAYDLISLHLIQEAYDFLKYWKCDLLGTSFQASSFCKSDISWSMTDLFAINDEDNSYFVHNNFAVAALLIKILYYFSLQAKETFVTCFLPGTHNRLGKNSSVHKLSGNEGVLRLIYSFYRRELPLKNYRIRDPRIIRIIIDGWIKSAGDINWKTFAEPMTFLTALREKSRFYIKKPEDMSIPSNSLEFSVKCWANHPEAMKFIKDYCGNKNKKSNKK
jgi:hypothetical protein